VDHSVVPRGAVPWGKGHMGQISMEIRRSPGSLLTGNQQPADLSVCFVPLCRPSSSKNAAP
jgi:hypothetical protein